jgi:hypothetical protein
LPARRVAVSLTMPSADRIEEIALQIYCMSAT